MRQVYLVCLISVLCGCAADENSDVGQKASNEQKEFNVSIGQFALSAGPCAGEINRIIRQSEFEARLQAGGIVELPSCSLVKLERTTKIPAGVRLTTSASLPATIERSRNHTYGLVINGSNIVLENFRLDFNSGGTWRPFVAAVSFQPPKTDRDAAAQIDNVIIRNVEFVDSSAPQLRGSGDNWAISLSNRAETPMTNILLKGNKLLERPFTQLVANGYGRGIDGIEIADNIVYFGESNAIAISSGADKTAFENVTIRNNIIKGADRIGVFVGRDGQNEEIKILLSNICILENTISMKPKARFPNGLYLRGAGRGLKTPEVWIVRNMITTLDVEAFSPRFYSLMFESGMQVLTSGNELYGSGDRIVAPGVSVVDADFPKRMECYQHRGLGGVKK
jgi:hypothetical protein